MGKTIARATTRYPAVCRSPPLADFALPSQNPARLKGFPARPPRGTEVALARQRPWCSESKIGDPRLAKVQLLSCTRGAFRPGGVHGPWVAGLELLRLWGFGREMPQGVPRDRLVRKGGVVQVLLPRGHDHTVLLHYPDTARSAQFCLLCCQPEPVPRSSTARWPRLTLRKPCRLRAWSGRAIRTAGRT